MNPRAIAYGTRGLLSQSGASGETDHGRLILIFRFLHILGLAVLIGGAAARLMRPDGGFRALILGGAVAQVLTGLVLFFLSLGGDVDHLKITLKLVVAVVIVALLFLRTLQAKALGTWLVLVLAVINTGLAVFW